MQPKGVKGGNPPAQYSLDVTVLTDTCQSKKEEKETNNEVPTEAEKDRQEKVPEAFY